jgi:hypothetical protein
MIKKKKERKEVDAFRVSLDARQYPISPLLYLIKRKRRKNKRAKASNKQMKQAAHFKLTVWTTSNQKRVSR